MRQLLLAVGIILALAAQPQAQEKDAQAIIDMALKAQGGADKIKAIKGTNAKAKGTLVLMDMALDFTTESWGQTPGKMKEILNLSVGGQQIVVTTVFRDGMGWVSTMGNVMELDKEQMEALTEALYLQSVTNLVAIKDDKSIKLSLIGEAKVGDVPVVGVQVTKKDKKDISLYFDKKTNLLLKAEHRGQDPISKQDSAFEKIFSSYKEMVPGYKMASKQLVNIDGKRYMELELTEVLAAERLDDSIFNKPD